MAKRKERSIAGLVVAITGAAQGLGRITAEHLLREGAEIAIGDIDFELAQKAAGELGGKVRAYQLDVTDKESFSAFLEAAEADHGPIDVLINNAGIMPAGPFLEEDDPLTKRQFDINVHGVVFGMKLMLPKMVERGSGHIVNISSASGKAPIPGLAVYSASKHAVVGLSEAVIGEIRGRGVDISYVMSNLADTELAAGLRPSRFMRLVKPQQVARAIVKEVKRPKVEVYVPSYLGVLLGLALAMPRPLRVFINDIFKTDRITSGIDTVKRGHYQERITK